MDRIKKLFRSELSFRVFIVLQVISLLYLFYYDVTRRGSWDFLPSYSGSFSRIWKLYRWDWDLFRGIWWDRGNNFIALTCLFGPYVSTKAFEWIKEASDNEK